VAVTCVISNAERNLEKIETIVILNIYTTVSVGCPTIVTISPSTGPFTPGQVLTCSADGTATLTYEWTNSNGDVVSSTSTVSLPSSGAFTYTCTATGNLPGQCTVSGSVSGTTNSKYRKQHNALVGILMQSSIQHSVMILLCWITNTTDIYHFRESALVKNWTNYLHSPNVRTCIVGDGNSQIIRQFWRASTRGFYGEGKKVKMSPISPTWIKTAISRPNLEIREPKWWGNGLSTNV